MAKLIKLLQYVQVPNEDKDHVNFIFSLKVMYSSINSWEK